MRAGGLTFKTTDGGASWTAIDSGIINNGISSLAIDPFNSQVVYVGTPGAGGCGGGNGAGGCGPDIPGGVYKTTDGGATWTAVNAGITNFSIRSLAVDPKTAGSSMRERTTAGSSRRPTAVPPGGRINSGTTGNVFVPCY